MAAVGTVDRSKSQNELYDNELGAVGRSRNENYRYPDELGAVGTVEVKISSFMMNWVSKYIDSVSTVGTVGAVEVKIAFIMMNWATIWVKLAQQVQ